METEEAFRARGQREQRLRARLRLAAFRLEAAAVERVWAVRSAHRQGLSIRAIAAAVGRSRARVHQLLRAPAAAEAPARLNALREGGWPLAIPDAGEAADAAGGGDGDDSAAARLAEEAGALREGLAWLARLDRGEPVVVNLLPAGPAGTVTFLFTDLERSPGRREAPGRRERHRRQMRMGWRRAVP